MDKRPALGKGLSALIPTRRPDRRRQHARHRARHRRLAPNDYQPRLQIDDARLDELARLDPAPTASSSPSSCDATADGSASSPASADGARRSAPVSSRAGRGKDVSGDQAPAELLEMALIENIQREDLNAIDEATAYRRLVDDFALTQEAVAAAVGKDRATVANTLRLLKLPDEVQDDVAAGALSMGHARALLALPATQRSCSWRARSSARPLGARDRSTRQAALEGGELDADAPREPRRRRPPRRPHARSRGQAEDRRSARVSHHAQGQGRPHRDRLRQRGRADPHLRKCL